MSVGFLWFRYEMLLFFMNLLKSIILTMEIALQQITYLGVILFF